MDLGVVLEVRGEGQLHPQQRSGNARGTAAVRPGGTAAKDFWGSNRGGNPYLLQGGRSGTPTPT